METGKSYVCQGTTDLEPPEGTSLAKIWREAFRLPSQAPGTEISKEGWSHFMANREDGAQGKVIREGPVEWS